MCELLFVREKKENSYKDLDFGGKKQNKKGVSFHRTVFFQTLFVLLRTQMIKVTTVI